MKTRKRKIVTIGLGYVGLPLMIAIARTGKFDTRGFDISEDLVGQLQKKQSKLEDNLVQDNIAEVDYQVSTDISILEDFDIAILCVPTPVDSDSEPDLRPLKAASKSVAKYIKKGAHVLIESTVNPGVSNEVIIPLMDEVSGLKAGVDYHVGYCPERINPGDPNWNVTNIPRNVGATTMEAAEYLADFYRTFVTAEVQVVSNIKVAEASKIVENTFRDVNIAFVNELAKSFDAMGIDVYETIKAASNKPFGFLPHWPGAGVGGHCIAVDPYYLIKRASLSGFDHKFVKLAREINDSMPEYTVELLIKELNNLELPLKGTKVLLYGMAFKPGVADVRESPSFEILEILEEYGADVVAYDPHAEEYSAGSLEGHLKWADAMIIATAHKEVVELDHKHLANLKVLIDGRNCREDKDQIADLGVSYKGVGR